MHINHLRIFHEDEESFGGDDDAVTADPDQVDSSPGNTDSNSPTTQNETVISNPVTATPTSDSSLPAFSGNSGLASSPPLPTHTSHAVPPDNQWHAAFQILKQRYRGNKRQFLIQWQDLNSPTSWVKMKDVSPKLLEEFYIARNRKGNLRHRRRR